MSCELSIQRTLGGGGSATIRCFGVIAASPPWGSQFTSTCYVHLVRRHTELAPSLSRQSCLVLLLNTSTFHLCKMSEAAQYPSALPISLLLALHGFRKGSLSPTGAVAAFAAGYGHIANPLKVFGVTLIVFYFLGSRATKVSTVSAALACRLRHSGKAERIHFRSRSIKRQSWKMAQIRPSQEETGTPYRWIKPLWPMSQDSSLADITQGVLQLPPLPARGSILPLRLASGKSLPGALTCTRTRH